MNDYINSLLSLNTLKSLIDILVVWYIVYQLFVLIKGTKAFHLLKGIVIVILIKLVSYFLGLNTLDWIMNLVIQWGVVALIVVFQPEIRRGLEHIGRTNLFGAKTKVRNRSERVIEEITTSVQYMAKRRIGALISIEKEHSLQEFISTGIAMNADISNQLITNIFIPNTPLHDGAVIIKDLRVAAAACYLPLSENPLIPKELGTRHRAALGVSEITDALTIIISEETGAVSVAYRDQLLRELSAEKLENVLKEHIFVKEEAAEKHVFSIIKGFLNIGGGADDE